LARSGEIAGMNGLRILFALGWCLVVSILPGFAAGPVETSVFAVQGVAVDVTDTDATTAKNKAIVDAQMKAFLILAERLGNPDFVIEMAKLESTAVVPLLKSLSIEEESTSPGRYIGKLTIRFLPDKMKNLYGRYGISVATKQSKPILVIPVWTSATGPQLWEQNLWRTAWLNLKAEQAAVPLIVPLGDAEDLLILSAEDAKNGNPVKLEAIRRRYDTKSMLLAFAEATPEGGIHARLSGVSELGKINIDKIYTADVATLEASAELAVMRFQSIMTEKLKSGEAKAVAAAAAAAQEKSANASRSIPVAIPFSSPSEWNGIRSRILSTPGVIGVDVSTLDGEGAVVRLMFVGEVASMQSSLEATGLQLGKVGNSWVIQGL
jgi:Uncharacterized protein conserved in bacteria (DUF2066)